MINTITITDFRNHSKTRINTGGAKNIVITGPNGSGKTAILESISVFGGNGSLRGATMSELTRFGTTGFGVVVNLSDETDISVSWGAGDTYRHAAIDGNQMPLCSLSKCIRVVWITPKEDRLFIEGTADRRSFFDKLCASFDSAHIGRVGRLAKLLSERAFALRSGGDAKWLMPLDKNLAAVSTAISCARIKYAGEINYFLSEGSAFSKHHSMVSMSGWFEDRLNNKISAVDVEKEYVQYLIENRTLTGDKMNIDGAHKSDFGMFNETLKLPVGTTSTGQQKSALLSLIIAHAKLIKSKCGDSPIVLLDEAVAHLDDSARAALFAELSAANAQVWVTGIDSAAFKDIGDALFVTCNDGKVNYMMKS